MKELEGMGRLLVGEQSEFLLEVDNFVQSLNEACALVLERVQRCWYSLEAKFEVLQIKLVKLKAFVESEGDSFDWNSPFFQSQALAKNSQFSQVREVLESD